MATPLGIRNCAICGKEIEIFHVKRLNQPQVYCSVECSAIGSRKPPNCECIICGKKMRVKPSHLNRLKTGITCSHECDNVRRQMIMAGERNHQFGLKGSLNASWKSDERLSSYGYKLIRCLSHPLRNSDDFVFEHRLIAETYLLTDENSIEINGVRYLSPEFDVHHIDMDRLNNNVDNLYVLLKSVHRSFHTKHPNLLCMSIEDRRKIFFEFINNMNQ